MRVEGLRFGADYTENEPAVASGIEFRVEGSGFRVQGLGFEG